MEKIHIAIYTNIVMTVRNNCLAVLDNHQPAWYMPLSHSFFIVWGVGVMMAYSPWWSDVAELITS